VGVLLMYVGVYTPLKRYTSFCTAVGAVPGALPPVLGWTAAGGSLDAGALALFGILFLWQFPHFLAIAWMYREDYRLGGLRMLPRRQDGGIVGRLAVTYALVLIPVSLLPHTAGLAGETYVLTAIILGLGYLFASIAFAFDESRKRAKRLLWASLIYLPLLLAALTIDHWRLLG
jgi:protoheme IX farnesyltransferase